MITERAERRILGAVQLVSSVTRLPIPGPIAFRVLEVTGNQPPPLEFLPPLRILSNGRGLGILHEIPGMANYTGNFDPAAVVPRTLRLQAFDHSGAFLPAEFTVTFPRTLDATRLANGHFNADSTFEPVIVAMLPSPRAVESVNWAVLRVHLRHEVEVPPPPAPPSGVFRTVASRGALIRVLADENAPRRLLGRGLTEWRALPRIGRPAIAEALVAIPDIPVTQWANQAGPNVLTPDQAVRIQVRVDLNFDPDDDEAIPDLNRLDPAGNAPLPNRVLAGELAAPRQLRTGLRETLRLFLDRNGVLTIDP